MTGKTHGVFHVGGRDASLCQCIEELSEVNEEDLLSLILDEIIKYAGEEELAKVDTEHLTAFMSAVMVEVVRLLEARDKQQADQGLSNEERAELELLRLRVKEQATDLDLKDHNISDLIIQLKDAQAMRDKAERALAAVRAAVK